MPIFPEHSVHYKVHSVSCDGRLAWGWCPGGYYLWLNDGTRSVDTLIKVSGAVAFSRCNRWVACIREAGLAIELSVFSISELSAGVTVPRFSCGAEDGTSLAFDCDGALLVAAGNSLRRGNVDGDGSVSFETLLTTDTGRFCNVCSYLNAICVELSDSALPYILVDNEGKILAKLKCLPIGVDVGVVGNELRTWKDRVIGPVLGLDLKEFFCAGHMQPDVLKEWIKFCAPNATWDRTGLTLLTNEGSVTVMWPPVAKLLEPAEAHEYRLRCAVESGFYEGFGMTADEAGALCRLQIALFGSHQGLWDAYEDVQRAAHALTLTPSKSQALAAFGRARSTSDEPALTQELSTALVSSLCHSDRLAFRHHEPGACKRVNSVLDLVCAASDKPSDPWCEEEAVNLALSQCGKPAAHAQRAALRLGVELGGVSLIPPFRKLATHTHIDIESSKPCTIADLVSLSLLTSLSNTGEYFVTHNGLYSSLSGQRVLQADAFAFSPCGDWVLAVEDDLLTVYSIDDLRRGKKTPAFTLTEPMVMSEPVFAHDSSFFIVDEEYRNIHGAISPDGSVVMRTFLEDADAVEIVINDRVYAGGSIFSFSAVEIGTYTSRPVTQSVFMDAAGRGMLTALRSSDGDKLGIVDVPMLKLSWLFNARFLKPSVLADLIKLIDERITWSDKGISLPTVDGRKLSVRWEPADGLPQCG